MYALARHCSLFVVFGFVSISISLFLIWDFTSVPDFPPTLATRYQYHYDTTASDYLYTTHTMGKRSVRDYKKTEGEERTIMDGNGAGLPLAMRRDRVPERRPALSGVPELCGTKMTEAALSILCNVSCHQN